MVKKMKNEMGEVSEKERREELEYLKNLFFRISEEEWVNVVRSSRRER
jgi:hypothetical protein